MLIPFSTDAPLYHYPISTVAIIVINIVLYFSLPPDTITDLDFQLEDPDGRVFNVEEVDKEADRLLNEQGDVQAFLDSLSPVKKDSARDLLTLQFGRGWRPWQWLTAMFMHADIMHLLGNMVFLWAFGLVLEGKMGPWLFTAAYLTMGIVQAALIQTIMFFSTGAALGASGAIFSLLALVCIFAPVNSFQVVAIFIRIFVFEMPIMFFGFFYVAWNGVFFLIQGGQMSSEALHLAGFAVGAPIGFTLLIRGIVDCEGYDIVSYMTGKEGRESQVGKKARRERLHKQRAEAKAAEPSDASKADLIRSQIEQAIAEKNFPGAIALQRKLTQVVPNTTWEHKHLLGVIQGFLAAKDYVSAEGLMLDYVGQFEQYRFQMQTKLLKIWLAQHRPRKVLKYIQGLNPAFLERTQREQLRPIAHAAQEQIRNGTLEVESSTRADDT